MGRTEIGLYLLSASVRFRIHVGSHKTDAVSAPRFTLRQLEIFVAVAQTGSVSRAAEMLHLSPSATSAAITELERSVSTDLCTRRKGRGVQLTSEGRILQKLALRLLDDAVEVGNLLAEHHTGGIHGTLRLGCYTPMSASFLPTLMQGFHEEHPSVELELTEGPENDLYEKMLDGLIDVALCYMRSCQPPTSSTCPISDPFARK